MPIEIIRYTHQRHDEWNCFIKKAVNSTFLFEREYMEYHSDRFVDCSLMFYRKGVLLAVLPANIVPGESVLQSHGGLTYGGLVMHHATKAVETLEIFDALAAFMRHELKVQKLVYKPLPQMYCARPADEPLYALFRMGATIVSRAISTAIDNSNREEFRERRRCGIKKAARAGVECAPSVMFGAFWEILSNNLRTVHNCKPTHVLEEIELLHTRFPNSIKLYTACIGVEIVAGIVVYETERVAHFQYIAASPKGKECGALDALVSYLVNEVYTGKSFVDFGISTEQGGMVLNCGLIEQKEGFGGRAVVYDTYELVV